MSEKACKLDLKQTPTNPTSLSDVATECGANTEHSEPKHAIESLSVHGIIASVYISVPSQILNERAYAFCIIH